MKLSWMRSDSRCSRLAKSVVKKRRWREGRHRVPLRSALRRTCRLFSLSAQISDFSRIPFWVWRLARMANTQWVCRAPTGDCFKDGDREWRFVTPFQNNDRIVLDFEEENAMTPILLARLFVRGSRAVSRIDMNGGQFQPSSNCWRRDVLTELRPSVWQASSIPRPLMIPGSCRIP